MKILVCANVLYWVSVSQQVKYDLFDRSLNYRSTGHYTHFVPIYIFLAKT